MGFRRSAWVGSLVVPLLVVGALLPAPVGGHDAVSAAQSCSNLPPGAVCELEKYPYLNAVANWLNFRSAGTEGKVWWVSLGNYLPAKWLLQTPHCWGKDRCPDPTPGGETFVE